VCYIRYWLYCTTLSATQPVGMKGSLVKWQGSDRERSWSNAGSGSASEAFALLGCYVALVGNRYLKTNQRCSNAPEERIPRLHLDGGLTPRVVWYLHGEGLKKTKKERS
jgi:hypothetical protein